MGAARERDNAGDRKSVNGRARIVKRFQVGLWGRARRTLRGACQAALLCASLASPAPSCLSAPPLALAASSSSFSSRVPLGSASVSPSHAEPPPVSFHPSVSAPLPRCFVPSPLLGAGAVSGRVSAVALHWLTSGDLVLVLLLLVVVDVEVGRLCARPRSHFRSRGCHAESPPITWLPLGGGTEQAREGGAERKGCRRGREGEEREGGREADEGLRGWHAGRGSPAGSTPRTCAGT
jgi:hypothetical protein